MQISCAHIRSIVDALKHADSRRSDVHVCVRGLTRVADNDQILSHTFTHFPPRGGGGGAVIKSHYYLALWQ